MSAKQSKAKQRKVYVTYTYTYRRYNVKQSNFTGFNLIKVENVKLKPHSLHICLHVCIEACHYDVLSYLTLPYLTLAYLPYCPSNSPHANHVMMIDITIIIIRIAAILDYNLESFQLTIQMHACIFYGHAHFTELTKLEHFLRALTSLLSKRTNKIFLVETKCVFTQGRVPR